VSDRYVVVLEQATRNYSAYVPDLPGCVATGASIEEAVTAIREAMALHIQAMRRDRESVPPPRTRLADPGIDLSEDAVGVVEVTVATSVAA
jgi:predicted RNase H-like HicB family nuclease